jgi:peptidoglycan/LPS O-acetylase OafA/YrhL
VGAISFTLYLVHKPVLWIMYGLVNGSPPYLLDASDIALTCLSLAVALLLSWGSCRCGSRWQALGHRYRYH